MTNPTRPPSLTRGLLAGALGGLVASWVMNLFIRTAMNAQEAAKTPEQQAREQAQEQTDEESEDSTIKVADAVTWLATGRHLSQEGKQKGGPIVHYAFGTLIGACYGALAQFSKSTTAYAGTAFGTGLFIAADEIMVPALGLSKPPTQQPASNQLLHYAAHLVYGATTEVVRRCIA